MVGYITVSCYTLASALLPKSCGRMPRLKGDENIIGFVLISLSTDMHNIACQRPTMFDCFNVVTILVLYIFMSCDYHMNLQCKST